MMTYCGAVRTSDALVPPNPNEFDSAAAIAIFLGLYGTRSISVSIDGLSRLRVGGAIWSRIASVEKIASTAPAAPKRCPIEDFVDDMASLPAELPNRRSTARSSI